MKKRQVLILIAGLCGWVLASMASAEVWIKNLSVEKKGEFVAIKIYGSQTFQFTHASEVAKNGKPFRVFVDCQDAKLGLSQNNFFNLPGQTVVGLRTSQYQESPSNIVRIVLDCTRPVTYKIVNQDNWVEIDIASPNEPAFARWEAAKTDQTQVAQTTAPSKNQPVTTTPSTAQPTKPAPVSLPEVTVQAQKPKTDLVKKEEKPTASPTTGKTPTLPATSNANKSATQTPTLAGKDNPPASPTSNAAKTAQPLKPSLAKPTVPQLTATESKNKLNLETQKVTPALTQKPTTVTTEQKPLVLAHKAEAEQWTGYPSREKVSYGSQGRRDPFSSLFDRVEDYEFGVPPLASIENLSLVGILQSFDQNLALLEDSRGFGYILQAGDRIKDGRVLRVDDDRVIFQVSEYGWTRNVSLELYKQTK
jgi:hypothetical protein